MMCCIDVSPIVQVKLRWLDAQTQDEKENETTKKRECDRMRRRVKEKRKECDNCKDGCVYLSVFREI